MKKMILILTMASTFVACKDNLEKTAAQTAIEAAPIPAPEPVQPVVVQKEVRYVPQQPAAAPVQQKKGWSKAAKGAVIGGGVGAVTGAIVSKKKGKGAIIGGVLGAGAGYVIGRSQDKKDGRVTK